MLTCRRACTKGSMTAIEIKLPAPVLRQAQELAALEDMPLDQFLTLALTQIVSTWNAERQKLANTRSNARGHFLELLQQALDEAPANPAHPPNPPEVQLER